MTRLAFVALTLQAACGPNDPCTACSGEAHEACLDGVEACDREFWPAYERKRFRWCLDDVEATCVWRAETDAR